MFNQSGITASKLTADTQILADVELQSSVGCVVPKTLGVDVNGKKIVKAGMPIKLDLMNLTTAATDGTTAAGYNAVVLHDVDVTVGNANATALIFGFVNVNRVDSVTAGKLTSQTNNSKVVLMKL